MFGMFAWIAAVAPAFCQSIHRHFVSLQWCILDNRTQECRVSTCRKSVMSFLQVAELEWTQDFHPVELYSLQSGVAKHVAWLCYLWRQQSLLRQHTFDNRVCCSSSLMTMSQHAGRRKQKQWWSSGLGGLGCVSSACCCCTASWNRSRLLRRPCCLPRYCPCLSCCLPEPAVYSQDQVRTTLQWSQSSIGCLPDFVFAEQDSELCHIWLPKALWMWHELIHIIAACDSRLQNMALLAISTRHEGCDFEVVCTAISCSVCNHDMCDCCDMWKQKVRLMHQLCLIEAIHAISCRPSDQACEASLTAVASLASWWQACIPL